jgi:hypothetical protein
LALRSAAGIGHVAHAFWRLSEISEGVIR